MIPARGGPPLPMAPLCLPRDHKSASRYVHQVRKAIDQIGWSPAQRVRLRNLYRKWLLRAEGRDSYFERYGTFPRPEGAPPPTTVDLVVARWRRRAKPETLEEKVRRLARGSVRKQIALMKKYKAAEERRRLWNQTKPYSGD